MSIDTLAKKFNSSYEEIDAINLMLYLINNKLYETGVYMGKFLYNVLPFSTALLEQYALCSYETKRYNLSYFLYNKLLENKSYSRTQSNTYLLKSYKCIEHIKDRYIGYINHQIKPCRYACVTFTITTCKRLSLFKETMNSFLTCCKDKHLIKEWICVDDNSDECDREEMKKLYPFFKFMFKTPELKGHSISMNLITNMVKTPYVFHMEDDWKFIVKKNYITECLEILSTNNVHQCALNRNYAEVENFEIKGGLFRTTNNGTRYYIHEYCKNEEEYKHFYAKYGECKNSAYWPHYTLRPSLILTKVFNTIGSFNIKAPHFEMEYAHRFTSLGYKTGFMEGIYCLHIGRLTSERHDQTIQNAYTLNGMNQFTTTPQSTTNPYVVVVNLDRRPDRMVKFNGLDIKRFSAIDGTKLLPTFQLQRIFQGNDYNMCRGMVACALSHMCIWIDFLYNKPSLEYITIFEDDIKFEKNIFENIKPITEYYNNWDIIYLGHLAKNKTQSQQPVLHLEKWSTHTSFRKSFGGTLAYIISKKGAAAMLEFINKRGMSNCIDTMQQLAADKLNVYYVSPVQITAECIVNNSSVDTDIQKDFVSLTDPNLLDTVVKIIEKYEPNWATDDKKLITIENTNKHIPNKTKIKIMNDKFLYIDNSYKDLISELYPERLKVGDKFHINYSLKD